MATWRSSPRRFQIAPVDDPERRLTQRRAAFQADRASRCRPGPAVTPDGRLIASGIGRARPLRRLERLCHGSRETGSRTLPRPSMAVQPGESFNPLLIHSGIGLGKTHLLEGINHGLKQFHPRLQIVQLTAEAFTNSFLDSMRSGTLSGFRARFRGAGGLIVDDVQFLAAKRATMTEFLYTFEALYDKGAPDRAGGRPAPARDRKADRRAGDAISGRHGRQDRASGCAYCGRRF